MLKGKTMSAIFGLISLNDNTKEHPATLESLGYEIAVDEEKNEVAIVGDFIPDGKDVEPYDCTTKEKALAFFNGVVEQKKLIGYNARLLLPGRVTDENPEPKPMKRFNAALIRELNSPGLREALGFNPTALIAKKRSTKKARAAQSDLFV